MYLALLRHWLATGALDQAEALAKALTTASPASIDAWSLRVRVARCRGDVAQAHTLQAELVARATSSSPFHFPVPAPARDPG